MKNCSNVALASYSSSQRVNTVNYFSSTTVTHRFPVRFKSFFFLFNINKNSKIYPIIMPSNITGTSNSASFSNSFYKVLGHAAISETNTHTHTDTWLTNKNVVKQNTEYHSSFPPNWKWPTTIPILLGVKKQSLSLTDISNTDQQILSCFTTLFLTVHNSAKYLCFYGLQSGLLWARYWA